MIVAAPTLFWLWLQVGVAWRLRAEFDMTPGWYMAENALTYERCALMRDVWADRYDLKNAMCLPIGIIPSGRLSTEELVPKE